MAINRLVILDAGSVVLLVYFLCQMEGRSEKNTTLVPTDLLVILSTLKKSVVCYKMSSSLFLKTAPSAPSYISWTIHWKSMEKSRFTPMST